MPSLNAIGLDSDVIRRHLKALSLQGLTLDLQNVVTSLNQEAKSISILNLQGVTSQSNKALASLSLEKLCFLNVSCMGICDGDIRFKAQNLPNL